MQKRMRPIYSHFLTAQAWSMRDLLYSQRENLFLRDQRQKYRASGQEEPILPARVANQNAGFASSCSLADSAI